MDSSNPLKGVAAATEKALWFLAASPEDWANLCLLWIGGSATPCNPAFLNKSFLKKAVKAYKSMHKMSSLQTRTGVSSRHNKHAIRELNWLEQHPPHSVGGKLERIAPKRDSLEERRDSSASTLEKLQEELLESEDSIRVLRNAEYEAGYKFGVCLSSRAKSKAKQHPTSLVSPKKAISKPKKHRRVDLDSILSNALWNRNPPKANDPIPFISAKGSMAKESIPMKQEAVVNHKKPAPGPIELVRSNLGAELDDMIPDLEYGSFF